MRFTFGDVVLDTDRFLLERGGEPVHVQPQVFDVLSYLVRNRDRVVPKTELLDAVWGDRFVSESTLTSRIKAARRVVGDDGDLQRVIKTAHGRGYRWVADVGSEHAGSEPVVTPRPDSRRLEQTIRFCQASDGVRIAYATVGEGPPLVRAAHWITHLDYEWESPVWRHWMEGFSRGRTFIRYDERGCGLSDHDPEDISFESFVRDLETVVDELGLERFPLMGLSQGGPVAVEYAVRHPERVSRLILIGAFVTGRLVRASTPEELREAEMQAELIRMGWGRDDPSFRLYFSSTFMPDAPPQLWSDFAALMRRTTSAENALRLNNVSVTMDVREAATRVQVPTLILHGRNEVRIPFSQGREFAARIRGSRLVPLDTRNHLLQADEPAWEHLLSEVDAFLADDESTNRPAEVHPLSEH
ncbi:alpha/beta fold hydrolase [Intrasporangium calvum]|uniref:Alpha/beta fold hydrolase n=1 Tax=Intrasporangium calvum TaxID=53358 RepID=A0ABT5GLE7_9MICO|nr:alpha/beta fold hydrolase [Intrasporangium calvum]MDC5698883.1 alpha/beta fold hydrolase [Intrasporangium calvum]